MLGDDTGAITPMNNNATSGGPGFNKGNGKDSTATFLKKAMLGPAWNRSILPKSSTVTEMGTIDSWRLGLSAPSQINVKSDKINLSNTMKNFYNRIISDQSSSVSMMNTGAFMR